MRFIVDESTGAAVVRHLCSAGHDVVDVAEKMPQAGDPAILTRAAGENRVLVTNDKDFGELVFRGRQPHSGVLLLRLQDESSANRVRVVQTVLERYADRLHDSFIVATDGYVRIRPGRQQL
jgi:predicted nuclease of predicted toxin-antitoxin system